MRENKQQTKKPPTTQFSVGLVYIPDTTPYCPNTQSLLLDGLKYSCHGCCLDILKHHDYREKGCVSIAHIIMFQILNTVKLGEQNVMFYTSVAFG